MFVSICPTSTPPRVRPSFPSRRGGRHDDDDGRNRRRARERANERESRGGGERERERETRYDGVRARRRGGGERGGDDDDEWVERGTMARERRFDASRRAREGERDGDERGARREIVSGTSPSGGARRRREGRRR